MATLLVEDAESGRHEGLEARALLRIGQRAVRADRAVHEGGIAPQQSFSIGAEPRAVPGPKDSRTTSAVSTKPNRVRRGPWLRRSSSRLRRPAARRRIRGCPERGPRREAPP